MEIDRLLSENADASTEIAMALIKELPGILFLVVAPGDEIVDWNNWTAQLLSNAGSLTNNQIGAFLVDDSLETWKNMQLSRDTGVLRFQDSLGLETSFTSRVFVIQDYRVIVGIRHNAGNQNLFNTMTEQLNRSYEEIARQRIRRQQLTSLVQSLPILLIFADGNGQILHWTPYCETILGAIPEEWTDRNPHFIEALETRETVQLTIESGAIVDYRILHIQSESDHGGGWYVLQRMDVEIPFPGNTSLPDILDDLGTLVRIYSEEDSEPRFTAREQSIVDLLLDNIGDQEIGARIGISTSTVKAHISSIIKKSHVKNRWELMRLKNLDQFREPITSQEIERAFRRVEADLTLSRDHASTFFRDRRISRREHDVLRLVLSGLSNKEIGDHLNISVPTVKSHLHSAYRKLEIKCRAELFYLIRKLGKNHTSG